MPGKPITCVKGLKLTLLGSQRTVPSGSQLLRRSSINYLAPDLPTEPKAFLEPPSMSGPRLPHKKPNTPEKVMNPPYSPKYGLDSTTTVLIE